MKNLKTYLYARFGSSINLEEGAPWLISVIYYSKKANSFNI